MLMRTKRMIDSTKELAELVSRMDSVMDRAYEMLENLAFDLPEDQAKRVRALLVDMEEF